ncbi:MAG: hypothetical protein FWC70_11505 [Defluviitaleaceae bacterium]|nr:hypothetical protein [Defluviitaleaceae bacterium]
MKKISNACNRINKVLNLIITASVIVSAAMIAVARLIFFVVLLIVFYAPAVTFFDPPPGALNGEWSASLVAAGHRSLVSCTDELASDADAVIRAEITGRSYEIINIGLPGYRSPYQYTVYQLRVLDVYKGDIEIFDIIETLQLKRRSRPTGVYSMNMQQIRLPLETGDDLILFLNFYEVYFSPGTTDLASRFALSDREQMWTFNPIQGVYCYAPANIRAGYGDWTFKSINAHNNLTLSEQDLLRIAERYAKRRGL